MVWTLVAKKRRKKKRRKKSRTSRSIEWHRDPIQSQIQAAIEFITRQRRERARRFDIIFFNAVKLGRFSLGTDLSCKKEEKEKETKKESDFA